MYLALKDKEFYINLYSQLYARGYHDDPNYSHARPLLSLLKYFEDQGKIEFDSVLDIGCARGWALRQLAAAGKDVEGIDPSAIAVADCEEQNVAAQLGVAHDLPFNDQQFDLVMSTDTFEHIHPDHIDESIMELQRVARKVIAMRICPKADQAPWKEHAGHDLHLTVKPIKWWLNRIQLPGWETIYFDKIDTFVLRKWNYDYSKK